MGFFNDLFGSTAARGARKAGETQAAFANKARKKAIEEVRPYEEIGRSGLDLYSTALGLKGQSDQQGYFANFQNDPGYQATLEAGLDAVGQGQSFAGNYRSGNTLRALMQHGQRMQYEQFQNRLNRLAGVGDMGANMAGKIADIQYGGKMSEGNALASGIVGAANARTGAAQGIFTGLSKIAASAVAGS